MWGFPKIDGTLLPPTGDDFWLDTNGEFLAYRDDKLDVWPPLLPVEVEPVVLGLPPAPLGIEVVREPNIIGEMGMEYYQKAVDPVLI